MTGANDCTANIYQADCTAVSLVNIDTGTSLCTCNYKTGIHAGNHYKIDTYSAPKSVWNCDSYAVGSRIPDNRQLAVLQAKWPHSWLWSLWIGLQWDSQRVPKDRNKNKAWHLWAIAGRRAPTEKWSGITMRILVCRTTRGNQLLIPKFQILLLLNCAVYPLPVPRLTCLNEIQYEL